MGERKTWLEKCPKCTHDIEGYDAPTSMIWDVYCIICGYRDAKQYYIHNDLLILCTQEQFSQLKNRPT